MIYVDQLIQEVLDRGHTVEDDGMKRCHPLLLPMTQLKAQVAHTLQCLGTINTRHVLSTDIFHHIRNPPTDSSWNSLGVRMAGAKKRRKKNPLMARLCELFLHSLVQLLERHSHDRGTLIDRVDDRFDDAG
ncbi:hypothetical protein GOODEAATRI_015498 [Goodea atripinnis]|uniref:Uncharacterized protein n=1 Tax=Goodea atripinnis TaxID=208336 RepID=A0ABV0PY83_9TELE